MTKKDYRAFFAQCKVMLKMNYFCKLVGIHPVNFSRFMKDSEYDWCISIEKLNELYDCIIGELEKIA